ncbi:patatin-like phospholipase family protein [Candidatus Mesenet endosymbiont of Phosphuga atrata]|uniref:patatin-like phospholipase family protein n=1 Tax=Candidatus Mesenet endosymbiont of Phosphuga atrata TaxID=3066221 RepID=UPI0030D0A721
MTKYVLSIDGGGIRGIIPAIVLAEIERRTKKTISQIFNLMAGTSTGGIIAAALCKKTEEGKSQYYANDCVNLYQEYGSYIFDSSPIKKLISWVDDAEYSNKNIEYMLDQYFGDSTIANVTNNLLLTSYDIYNCCPFLFKSWKEDSNFIKLQDALRATTAAPSYFIPKSLKIDEIDRVLVDGGVFANNPATCAYADSKKLFPNDNIVILSIGTGMTKDPITYASSEEFGKVTWVKHLLNILYSSESDSTDYQLNEIMNNRYIRIQSQLKIASHALDDVTPQNIQNLKQEAQIMIESNQKAIDDFCQIVT